jgi:hypothetical protein
VADQTPTPAQLRESAGLYTGLAVELRQFPDPWAQNEATHAERAAAALEEQAARLERPTTELRGWGVMQDGKYLVDCMSLSKDGAENRAALLQHTHDVCDFRAVPVRLVLDDTTSAADAQEGRTDGN